MRAFFFTKLGLPAIQTLLEKLVIQKKKGKKERKNRFLDLVYLSTNSLDPRENSNGYL